MRQPKHLWPVNFLNNHINTLIMAIIDAPVWRQNGQKIFAYKYPNINLSSKTQLNVGMSQEALLFINGELKQKYSTGKHTLDTANIPILRKLFGLPFGGQNPFLAEVWYINKADLLNISTQTDMFTVADPRYPNGLPLVADVTYGLKVAESEPFLLKLVNEESPLYDTSIEERFNGRFIREVTTRIATLADQNGYDLPSLNARRSRISEELAALLSPFIESYGLTFTDFNLRSLSIDTSDEARQITSGFGYDPQTYQQARMLDIQEKAMNNISNGDGGLLGAMLAMSMMNNSAPAAPDPATIQPRQPAANRPEAAPRKEENKPETHYVYCSNCGKKYTSDVRFCPYCGDEYWPCPKCGADNDRKNKRCVSCGTVLIPEQQVKCPNCGTLCPDDAQFCPQCGHPLKQADTCRQCGAPLNGARFCPQCGTQNKF